MSKLVRIDPNTIEWTKEDIILMTESGVKYGPATPSANAIIVDQGYYVAGVSVCDAGDYLSIVPYDLVDSYDTTARVGIFKSAVKNNGGSYALLRPIRMSSPWYYSKRGLNPARVPAVQIRIYKDHKVAILNHDIVDGQDVWYVDTRRKAPFGALWDDSLQGEARVNEGFTRQPDLIRVDTDEDVKKAASQIYLKDVSCFKYLIPNWMGDLSRGRIPRATATSYSHTSDATTAIFENFFNVMAPEKAGVRTQWKTKSGIDLDRATDATYHRQWMTIDAFYWAACNGNTGAQKAAATRQGKFEALIAPFASDLQALASGDDLWGRTDTGDILFAHRLSDYYTVATFFAPNGKMIQGTLYNRESNDKWEVASIANIGRAEIKKRLTSAKGVQTKFASGQTAKSIFAGTVVEELVKACAPVIIPAVWSGDSPETSTWDKVVTDTAVASIAAMAIYAESKPIISMLRKSGLQQWYAYALGSLVIGGKLTDLFAPTPASPRSRDWKYDQKAKTLEDALDLPMNLLRQISDAYDGSYQNAHLDTSAITGAFSREEYAQMSDDELQKFVNRVMVACGSSGHWKTVDLFANLKSDVPEFSDRRYLVQTDDLAAAKEFLSARKEITPEQWSSSWVLGGGAPTVYAYKDKVVKQLSVDEIVKEITAWHSFYKKAKWASPKFSSLESPEFRGIIAPIPSLEALRKELDALRIGQDASLVYELTHGNVYKIRKSSDPDTPYFILITSSDGTVKTLGYMGCDPSKSAQMRCLLQRRQMIYRDPIDVQALVSSQIAAIRRLENN